MKLYHDVTTAAVWNGGEPNLFRGQRLVMSLGTLPMEFVNRLPSNLDPNFVRMWASARNGTGVPIVFDDEGPDFSFNLALYQSNKAECIRRINNHHQWFDAARTGAPLSEISHWYVCPPPTGTDNTVLLDEYEDVVAPLIQKESFAIKDMYCVSTLTLETWRPYVEAYVLGCNQWGKEPSVALTPGFADTKQVCPWFEDQLHVCEGLGIKRVFVYTGQEDSSFVGSNASVVRRWTGNYQAADVTPLSVQQMETLALQSVARETKRLEIITGVLAQRRELAVSEAVLLDQKITLINNLT